MRDCFCWSSDLNEVEVSERRFVIAEAREESVSVGDAEEHGTV